jgi:serine protease Do
MRLLQTFVFFGLSVVLLCPCAAADTVVLKEGQKLTGDILAEKQAFIYLDIGVDILKLAKDSILEYTFDKDALPGGNGSQDAQPADDANSASFDPGKLYRTADLDKTTIEKCVDRVSEAVVKVSTPAGMGSGFFINENGYLITNYHVVERETKIEVTIFEEKPTGFEKKNFKKVRIIAINAFMDLALLKVEDLGETKPKFAYLGSSRDVIVGEGVFAVGNPLGLERTVTDGVISTQSRAFEGIVYLQTNADINPGNSGGPLFNLAGEVIGVTNMGYIFYGGLGFAIPVDYVKHFIDNRQAFAYDKDNPNAGFRYIQPDRRKNMNAPPLSTRTAAQ